MGGEDDMETNSVTSDPPSLLSDDTVHGKTGGGGSTQTENDTFFRTGLWLTLPLLFPLRSAGLPDEAGCRRWPPGEPGWPPDESRCRPWPPGEPGWLPDEAGCCSWLRQVPESGYLGGTTGWVVDVERAASETTETSSDLPPPLLSPRSPGWFVDVERPIARAVARSTQCAPTHAPELTVILHFTSKELFNDLREQQTGATGALFAAARGSAEHEGIADWLLRRFDVKRVHGVRQDEYNIKRRDESEAGFQYAVLKLRLRELDEHRGDRRKTSCSREPPPEGEECLWVVAAGSQKPSSKHYHSCCCRDGESDGSGPPPQAASCRILAMLGVASHAHEENKKRTDLGRRVVWKARTGPPGAARFAVPQECLDAERMVARLGNENVKVVVLWC
eukprot:TRINITY_DN1151_c0_g3_i1.p2 TRINITY_DN1151_c0_g3~~TRINITY_DN1151_c0_g3_i1.p2  ORF type:complete len:391 (+),score=110.08 TRINITY_DN1151_c0_g3_i1:59-1231(+)